MNLKTYLFKTERALSVKKLPTIQISTEKCSWLVLITSNLFGKAVHSKDACVEKKQKESIIVNRI